MLIFQFKDHDGALEFWTRVRDRGAERVDERNAILLEMAREGYMERVLETNRTKEQVIEDWSKHSKILHIKATDEGAEAL